MTQLVSSIKSLVVYDCLLITAFLFFFTGDSIPIGFWGVLESSLSITVACLPAINHYLRQTVIKVKSNVSSMMSRTPQPAREGNLGINHRPYGGAFRVFRGPMKTSYTASAMATTTFTMDTYREIEETSNVESGQKDIKVSRSVDVSTEEVGNVEDVEALRRKPSLPSIAEYAQSSRV